VTTRFSTEEIHPVTVQGACVAHAERVTGRRIAFGHVTDQDALTFGAIAREMSKLRRNRVPRVSARTSHLRVGVVLTATHAAFAEIIEPAARRHQPPDRRNRKRDPKT
jgi:hypothetical protein